MGKPVLLLRFEGPLQSWGSRSRWDMRDTESEPTKSGVVGLLGCAFGYERGDYRLEEMDAGLRFGVRVESAGRILEDFQTITDFLPTAAGEFRVRGGIKSRAALRNDLNARPATILSPRFYLEDAAFLVALEATEEADTSLLSRCREALNRPAWPLFLGRRSCVPTRPIFEALVDTYDGLQDAFQNYPWSWLGASNEVRERDRPLRLTAYVEDQNGLLLRQDCVRINTARQYGFHQARQIDIRPVPAVDLLKYEKSERSTE